MLICFVSALGSHEMGRHKLPIIVIILYACWFFVEGWQNNFTNLACTACRMVGKTNLQVCVWESLHACTVNVLLCVYACMCVCLVYTLCKYACTCICLQVCMYMYLCIFYIFSLSYINEHSWTLNFDQATHPRRHIHTYMCRGRCTHWHLVLKTCNMLALLQATPHLITTQGGLLQEENKRRQGQPT